MTHIPFPATHRRATLVATLVAAVVAVPLLALAAEPLAPGVSLSRILVPAGPQRVRVLRIDPAARWRLAVATAGPVGTYALTSTIAKRAGAIAAVNGGFGLFPGLPTHLVEAGGTLRTTGLGPGPVFAVGADGTPSIGMPGLRIVAQDPARHRHVRVFTWNRPSKTVPGTVNGFTSAGGFRAVPASSSCAVRMVVAGPAKWVAHGALTRTYRVTASACGKAPMAVLGHTVLAGALNTPAAAWLRRLVPGNTLSIRTSFAWPSIVDAVGGRELVTANKIEVPTRCTTWICIRQPRTGVGITADGTVLLVTVDGRVKGSAGMTLYGFGLYLRSLGAVNALDLDGGGGTTMWTKADGIVNHPSDSTGQRPVTSAVLVRATPDAG